MRPISLAVDVTNYVMLALGQPLHAYDLALLRGPVVVRRARAGERLHHPRRRRAGARPRGPAHHRQRARRRARARAILGMAGVMGGAETEVTGATRDVLVEAAHFDAVSVGRTARRHRLPSEASKRFERGVDPALAPAAAELAVRLLVEHGGGTADDGVDRRRTSCRPRRARRARPAAARPAWSAWRTPTTRSSTTLEQIGCTVERADRATRGDRLAVTPPSWRPDLTGPADLVEEVARLRGYDAIPERRPHARRRAAGLTAAQRTVRRVREHLASRGLVEVLSYPFVVARGPRRARPARRRPPPPRAAPGQPAERRAAGDADEPAHPAARHRRPQPGPGRDRPRRSSRSAWSSGPGPDAPAAPACPGSTAARATTSSPRSTPPCPPQPRRLAAVLAGQAEPAGLAGPGAPGRAGTTPSTSPARSPRSPGSTSP